MDDRQVKKHRILIFWDVLPGVIPIRISNGATYRFVEVPDVTAAAEQDPFYNSRLQMINIRSDKFILLVHEGGELTLRMRPQAPWYWFLGDILLDSLNHTLLFLQQSGGDTIAIVFAVIPLVWAGWQIFRKRLSWQKIRIAMLIGIGAIIIQGVYILVRLDQVTITSKAVVFSPLSIVAAFPLSTCGALIYFQARSKIGKLTALFVITSDSWMPMVIGLVGVAIFNQFVFVPETGTALYNYALVLLPVGSFLFTFTRFSLVLCYINILIRRNSHLYEKKHV